MLGNIRSADPSPHPRAPLLPAGEGGPLQRWVRGMANGKCQDPGVWSPGFGIRHSTSAGRACIPKHESRKSNPDFCHLLFAICLLPFFLIGEAFSQVSPAEILSPRLKAAEQKYLPQLLSLNHAIASAKFPFPFVVSRYVGLDPKSQAGLDTRGLEFVKFHDRVVLKISGNYNAAYNAERVTQNQRADRVFNDVIVPILELIPKTIPPDVTCDAIGFEVSYHVQSGSRNYEYEGKEILAVVFDKADAFRFLTLPRDSERQEVVNRSEIYVSGKEFGLALGERNPYRLEELDRTPARQQAAVDAATLSSSSSDNRLSRINEDLPPALQAAAQPVGDPRLTVYGGSAGLGRDKAEIQTTAPAVATEVDADRLQAKYQSQLEALGKEGAERFHLAEYAPPAFVVFRNQIFLQLTLRNTQRFDKEGSSIYKRAAQSFDLFLAPQLKPILAKVPTLAELEGLDITVLDQFTTKTQGASEAIEFLCPLKPLRQFADAEITNQNLVNQSVVLVNGVRIALNLEQVE